MILRTFSGINKIKKSKSLVISIGAVILLTLISKVSGLFREQVMASYYGAGMEMDAYNIAYYLPNLFRMLIADAALISAFIPIMSSYIAQGDLDNANRVVNTVVNYILVFLTVLILIAFPFVPGLISILPQMKSNPELMKLSVDLTRIMLPTLVLMSLSGILSSIMNSFDNFASVSVSPVIFNSAIISAVILLHSRYGVHALAYGVLAGTLLQLIFLLLFSRRLPLRYKPELHFRHPGVRSMFALMLPATISLGCIQINESVDKIFALSIGTGFVSVLNYAIRIWYLPLGIFAVAVSTVLFPAISRMASTGDVSGMKSAFSTGMREIFFLMLPATAGIMVLSAPITRLIYERGEFTASNTHMVALTLFYFSIGLIPYSVLTLLNRVFYAMKDTRTPLIVAAISIFFNFVFDLILIRFLSYAGLALSTSLVGTANFLALAFLLRRKIGRLGAREIFNSVIRMALATALMSAIAYFIWYLLDRLLGRGTLSQILSLGSSIVVAIGAYIILCYAFKLNELKQLALYLKSKVSGVVIGSGES